MNKVCKIKVNIPLRFLFLKHLQAIDSSFVTIIKPLSKHIGETFWGGVKLICTFFDTDGQKDFYNPPIFSKSSKHFFIRLVQGNSC